MSHEPWTRADLIRQVQKTERARFRRALNRELGRIWQELQLHRGGNRFADKARKPIADTFDRLQASVAPKKPRLRSAKPRRITSEFSSGVSIGDYMPDESSIIDR